MRHHFDAQQWLPCSRELVFAFFANPENLPRLMPRWQKARIEEATFAPPPPRPESTPVFPGVVAGSGTRVTFSYLLIPYIPIRFPWEARIDDFRWNEGFSDTQDRGPFTYWHHTHTVEATAEPESNRPGTLIRDSIDYELPLGALGDLVNTLVVRRQIEALFKFRHARTAEILSVLDRLAT
ncbi:MAG: SRPBCC family protein [Acidobacteriota bacterium]